MPYSAVTHPLPLPFWCGGTFSKTLAVHKTCVSPNEMSTDPSACLVKWRLMSTERIWEGWRLLGRCIVVIYLECKDCNIALSNIILAG